MIRLFKTFLFKLGLIECVHEFGKWEKGYVVQRRYCKKCNIEQIR